MTNPITPLEETKTPNGTVYFGWDVETKTWVVYYQRDQDRTPYLHISRFDKKRAARIKYREEITSRSTR